MGTSRSLLLPIGLATFLLPVDVAVSLALVSTMAGFLHGHGQGAFAVTPPGASPCLLFCEPANLVADQGHITNAAGGTALVLVGFGGSIALWREWWTRKKVAIDIGVARANPPPARYPDGRWTPENWYAAVLDLSLASADQRKAIGGNLRRCGRGGECGGVVPFGVSQARRRDKQAVSMAEVLAEPSSDGSRHAAKTTTPWNLDDSRGV
ncbi:hypothetical protein N657DRAFT_719557 [Parathielavia appendiculata]|uniref:Uncharacterized protein n=1 Tax=Parathielavia appendiculata TaxID=2587402 RepID=A0AAN6TXU2_9PEZI|nr:hypothetical protein N657DRAFT_719557 [Parathielavia appendiculata]